MTQTDAQRDIFIAHGPIDTDWAGQLASELHRMGFEVWLDEWEMVAGDLRARRFDEAIAEASVGLIVVGETTLDGDLLGELYPALWSQASSGAMRVIPVLRAAVEVPPLLASREPIRFFATASFDEGVRELALAIAGRPPGERPDAAGGRPVVVRVSPTLVEINVDGRNIASHEPIGLSDAELSHLQAFESDRRSHRPSGAPARQPAPVDGLRIDSSAEVGRILRKGFLAGAVGEELDRLIERAQQSHTSVRLAFEAAPGLEMLPWHTTAVGSRPAALHAHVEVYGRVRGNGLPRLSQVPGPLRILAAIASPDEGGGELLDYEKELATLLDATEEARTAGKAHVRILEFGTLEAIRKELSRLHYHVLHISGHATPNAFVMEDEDGARIDATATDLLNAIPPNRLPMLAFLSGCQTGDVPRTAETGEAAAPDLARGLIRNGVLMVLAMTAPVTDRYATDLAGAFYRHLATGEPDPLVALAQARQDLESVRAQLPAGAPERQIVEWATPTLLAGGPVVRLYDRRLPFETIQPVGEPSLDPDIVVRAVGEFVGRRGAIRKVRRLLRAGSPAILLHGLGGVGKSTLAARILADAEDRIVVSMRSPITVDGLLAAVAAKLRSLAMAISARDEQLAELLRRVATGVGDGTLAWAERVGYLREHVLAKGIPLLLLLDNFEDDLVEDAGLHRITDGELAGLLSDWIAADRASVLVTSRFPFPISGSDAALQPIHLGPLSFAETRKLMWRLPALDALDQESKLAAWQKVGGHPRTLEYLDALLRGGSAPAEPTNAARARFAEVDQRLTNTIAETGSDPQEVMGATSGEFDPALSAAITLAADDVLLGGLMGMVDATPLGREVVLAVGVHRGGVDAAGLAFGLGDEIDVTAQMEAYAAARQTVREALDGATSQEEANQRLAGLPEEVVTVAFGGPPPPRSLPDGVDAAVAAAERLGLVAPTAPGWVVHRWTADTLTAQDADHYTTEAVTTAHRSAADYYQWRTDVWPQDRDADIADLYELRYHRFAAGDLDAGLQAGESIASQLETWGRYGDAQHLMNENLTLAPDHPEKAAWLGQLGILAHLRGDYATAEDWYRKALTIAEELGNRAGIATGYHQLGMLAHLRGDYATAEDWYRKALTIAEELGNRAGIAAGYHQLGILAHLRGDYDAAEDWYRKSLTIKEELGNRAGLAASHGQLGILAHLRGDYDAAEDWYRQSLTINQELGNRAGLAAGYHQLGMLAHLRGDYAAAEDWYRQALPIFEELGNRAGIASTTSQLGVLTQNRGQPGAAIPFHLQALSIRLDIGSGEAGIDLNNLASIREDLGDEQFTTELGRYLDPDALTAVIGMLDQPNEEESND